MLPAAVAAQKLEFVRKESRLPATSEEIAAEFEAIKKQPKGLKASAYKKHCRLELSPRAIDSLLKTRVEGFKAELRLAFPKFDSYPLTAQFALVDMAFNLGTNGVVKKFPSFRKAVLAGEWKKAAKESNRPQVSAARNATVRIWLEKAAGARDPNIFVDPMPTPTP